MKYILQDAMELPIFHFYDIFPEQFGVIYRSFGRFQKLWFIIECRPS